MSEIVRFHAIAAGGDAVGRDAQNRAIFAPFGAPGDMGEVEISEERASFARGEIRRLLEPSPRRVAPPCPFFRPQTPAHSCGGCQIQHLDYAAQLEAKRALVRDALERLGGLKGVEVAPCVASPQEFGYRNKADFVVGSGGQIGFFARESHDLVDISSCPIQGEPNNAILTAAREILAQNPTWAFDAQTGRGEIRRLVARWAGEKCLLLVVTNGPIWPEAAHFARLMREKVPQLVGVLQRGPREKGAKLGLVEGENWLEERVGKLRLRVTGEAFFQVNPFLTPLLVKTALELAPPTSGERVLDLFCGVGLFGLSFAAHGARIVGIESHAGAIGDARFNAKTNDLKAAFRVGSADRALREFQTGDFDLVLLDPPRAGAAACLEGLARLAPQRLIYISCDPATLARDARFLARHFTLRRVVPFDLFPQTAHVETLTLWEKI